MRGCVTYSRLRDLRQILNLCQKQRCLSICFFIKDINKLFCGTF